MATQKHDLIIIFSSKSLTCVKSYYIAKRDLKPKYQEARNGVTKIEAYSRAIEVALWTIEQDFDVSIGVEDMQGDTLKFTITADSRHQRDNAIQHIQGEFCDVSKLSVRT